MQNAKGTLIPIGGNEDKGLDENEKYTLEFVDEGILYHVVKEAGGWVGDFNNGNNFIFGGEISATNQFIEEEFKNIVSKYMIEGNGEDE